MLRIEFERRKRGWSQQLLAAKAERAQSVVAVAEAGVASGETLEALAQALHVFPPSVLLREVKVMPEPDEVSPA